MKKGLPEQGLGNGEKDKHVSADLDQLLGQRDGSAANGTAACSSRGPEFYSQTHMVAHNHL